MDPVTQASLGAVAAGVLARSESLRRALLVGALAGAAPDLDVFIKSAEDPLLQLQYHRHFTHSLLLAPVIGTLVALIISALAYRKKWKPRELIPFGIAGALTHGPLDACTSYGTLLYWPFSHHRESWDIISIIDPIFTLPMLILLIAALVWKRPAFAKTAAVLCLFYFTLGIIQRERAQSFAHELTASRGHEPQELSVRTSLGNIVLWRICYRHGDNYFVDAVRTLPGTEPRHYLGSSVPVFSQQDVENTVAPDSVLAHDIERFRFFSQGYLYRYTEEPNVIGDLRYSMFPNSTVPLWGIIIDPEKPQEHIEMRYLRDPSSRSLNRLWLMIQGKDAT